MMRVIHRRSDTAWDSFFKYQRISGRLFCDFKDRASSYSTQLVAGRIITKWYRKRKQAHLHKVKKETLGKKLQPTILISIVCSY